MRSRRARLPLADARRELAEIRARLVGLLQRTVGPALTAEEGQALLDQAKAWSPPMARELHAHIAEFPDALTAPSPHCPASLPRLLQALEAAGHGDAVTQLACAICGRLGRKIPRLTPQGRACEWCVARTELRPCSCCGKDGHIVTRTAEGGTICRSCYESRHRFTGACTDCGRLGTYRMRLRNETRVALCRTCAGFPDQECVRCNLVGPVHSNSAEGPVCGRCYVAPAKLCGRCGQVRPLAIRGRDGKPGVCNNCYRSEGICTLCGRFRDGARSSRADGAFLCDPCRPRPSHRCVDCGRNKKATVTTWPIGPLCPSCYSRRRRNPEPCTLCGVTRVLVGRSDDGLGTCGPCCGVAIDFTCRRCGSPADISTDGCCTRCVASDRVHGLLADENGQVTEVLVPLAQALTAAPRPRSVMAWLRRSPSAHLLATLAASQAEITHELLDDLPQEPATRYVRELLVHTEILPTRQENLVQLELWFRDAARSLPIAHTEIIRPFAEWFIIRDARRRAARGRYSPKAAHTDRSEIRAAIEFMQWLDDHHIDLRSLTQSELEVWLAQAKPSRPRLTAAFIKWTNRRGLTGNLEYPGRVRPAPATFLDDEDQADQLRRCLTDASLPLDVRIAGALIRLYGLPITRIVHLTVDQFHQDGTGAYFTFDKNPVLLPPTLARLIERRIAQGRQGSAVGSLPDSEHQELLLPNRLAGRPRSPGGLAAQLTKHDLPTLAARNTALFGMAGELPPIIMCDMFGIHRNTATQWAALAQDSWAGYLAALRATE